MLQLQTLGFQQSIDEIEDVETDSAAVDLREDVADLVNSEIFVEFNVGDLVLLGDLLNILAEKSCVRNMSSSLPSEPLTGSHIEIFGLGGFHFPVFFVFLQPLIERPPTASNYGQGEQMSGKLLLLIAQNL